MRRLGPSAAVAALVACSTHAQTDGAPAQELVRREQQWNQAIKERDVERAKSFLADDYFLAVAVAGQPLHVVPRETWLDVLPAYRIDSMHLGEMLVRVYGDVATVSYPYFQRATVRGADRSAEFMLTDVWVMRDRTWRVAARYSSRPEPGRGLPRR